MQLSTHRCFSSKFCSWAFCQNNSLIRHCSAVRVGNVCSRLSPSTSFILPPSEVERTIKFASRPNHFSAPGGLLITATKLVWHECCTTLLVGYLATSIVNFLHSPPIWIAIPSIQMWMKSYWLLQRSLDIDNPHQIALDNTSQKLTAIINDCKLITTRSTAKRQFTVPYRVGQPPMLRSGCEWMLARH